MERGEAGGVRGISAHLFEDLFTTFYKLDKNIVDSILVSESRQSGNAVRFRPCGGPIFTRGGLLGSPSIFVLYFSPRILQEIG